MLTVILFFLVIFFFFPLRVTVVSIQTRGVWHSRCVPLFSGYKLKSRKVVEEVKWISYFCFRVDRNEVSFKVEPNNLGLNASDVAKKIGECRIICCNINVIVKPTCSFSV